MGWVRPQKLFSIFENQKYDIKYSTQILRSDSMTIHNYLVLSYYTRPTLGTVVSKFNAQDYILRFVFSPGNPQEKSRKKYRRENTIRHVDPPMVTDFFWSGHTYSFDACRGRSTIDQASLSRHIIMIAAIVHFWQAVICVSLLCTLTRSLSAVVGCNLIYMLMLNAAV